MCLSILADAKLRSYLIWDFQTQSEELTGISSTESAAIPGEEVEAIVLPTTRSDSRTKIPINRPEGRQLRILSETFGIFKDVLEIIKADQYGTLVDIWREFLCIKEIVPRMEQSKVLELLYRCLQTIRFRSMDITL
jgi:hypothetical protein